MSTPEPIKVLVVEDSPVARTLLVHILESSPELKVCSAVSDGGAALEFLKHTQPDVIVMDLHMQGLDGYETTRRIMETQPVPIVICSASLDPSEVAATFQALEAGAVAVLAKPLGPGHPDAADLAAKLIETVTLMAGVKVVRRWPRARRPVVSGGKATPVLRARSSLRVVAIGTSTGGPQVLQVILGGLPRDFAAPVLVVQHIAPGFLPGLVEWLSNTTGFPTQIAVAGEKLLPGRAYFAPDGRHLGLQADGTIELSNAEPENGLRPAVSFLFRSVAAACGPAATGVLLTGMGKDGAQELAQLRAAGALTIAQDRASALVNGMPGEAVRLDAAVHVLAPPEIAIMLNTWATAPSRSPWAGDRA